MAAPAPRVEVYNTQYGDVTPAIVPPTIYETVQALGYQPLGDLYLLGLFSQTGYIVLGESPTTLPPNFTMQPITLTPLHLRRTKSLLLHAPLHR